MRSVGWESTVFYPSWVAPFVHSLLYGNWVHLIGSLVAAIARPPSWQSCHYQSLCKLGCHSGWRDRATAALRCEKTTGDTFEEGMYVLLFSENLPLTPSGKIKKTPATQLTEWMTMEGKNPGRVTPWMGRSFRNFFANSFPLFLYGCTREIYGFLICV